MNENYVADRYEVTLAVLKHMFDVLLENDGLGVSFKKWDRAVLTDRLHIMLLRIFVQWLNYYWMSKGRLKSTEEI